MSSNGVIGNEGKLPWHFPSDLKHFKNKTHGKTVIMGRKTFEAEGMPKPLPNRRNIVVTRNSKYAPPQQGIEIAFNFASAIKMCEGEKEVFIIGGSELYRNALPYAQNLYVTIVNDEYEGDTYFPDFDWTNYVVVNQESIEENSKRLTFIEAIKVEE